MVFLAYLAFDFQSDILQPLLLTFKCIPHPIFHSIGPNLAQILPQGPHTHFTFFD